MGNIATTIEARNKSLVRDRFEAWAQGTGSPFELLTDDAKWTIEGGSVASKTYIGREAFMSEVIRPFNARMSGGLKPTVRELCADGNIVVIFFDAKGTARDGKPYANTYFYTTARSPGPQRCSTVSSSTISGRESHQPSNRMLLPSSNSNRVLTSPTKLRGEYARRAYEANCISGRP
jgi:ketosteroid isomerase-like protein